jgi:hypothetical protein
MKMSMKHWCKDTERKNRSIQKRNLAWILSGPRGGVQLCTYLHRAEINLRNVHSNAHKVIAGFFCKSRNGGDVEVQLPS